MDLDGKTKQVNFGKMIKIFRKEGWILNPDDKIVNSILKRCEENNGECPCHNNGDDKHCPCSDYREKDIVTVTYILKNNYECNCFKL